MNAVIERAELFGRVNAVPSKSYTHRILICSAFADRPTEVEGVVPSGDVNATLGCLAAMGAEVRQGDKFVINPLKHAKNAVLDCGESGSTLRFMLAVAAAVGGEYTFTGGGRLGDRPNGPLLAVLESGGVETRGSFPIEMKGRLSGGVYEIDGSVSSQFISGLLLAAPLAGGLEIRIKDRLLSQNYVNITIDVMKMFGVDVKRTERGYLVGGGRYVSPGRCRVEGDWSNAAFMLACGLLSGEVAVCGLNPQSLQGDRRIIEVMRAMGGRVTEQKAAFIAQKSRIHGVELDIGDMIDAGPVVSFLAAAAEGRTVLTGTERLRLKESDRLAAIIEGVNAMGARAYFEEDGARLVIEGNPSLSGGTVDGKNDHRMVMSAAVLASLCGGTVLGAEAVNKSYPAFFADYRSIGGKFYVG